MDMLIFTITTVEKGELCTSIPTCTVSGIHVPYFTRWSKKYGTAFTILKEALEIMDHLNTLSRDSMLNQSYLLMFTDLDSNSHSLHISRTVVMSCCDIYVYHMVLYYCNQYTARRKTDCSIFR